MNNWTTGDVIIFGVAGYIAVFALLKLLRAQREVLIDQLDEEVKRERRQATTK